MEDSTTSFENDLKPNTAGMAIPPFGNHSSIMNAMPMPKKNNCRQITETVAILASSNTSRDAKLAGMLTMGVLRQSTDTGIIMAVTHQAEPQT
jgi:hypothetical protein